MRRHAKTETAQLEKEADKLLQTYITAKYPLCEVCGKPSYCGHHWIEKSRSNRLRYEEDNIIPICQSCHTKIHNLFKSSVLGSYNAVEIIIKKRGKKWKEKLEKTGRELVKTTPDWYRHWIEFYKEKIAKI